MNYCCEVCEKTMKSGYKKKHLKRKSHNDLSMSIVNRYCVKDPKVGEIKKILRKYVEEYSENLFSFYISSNGNYT